MKEVAGDIAKKDSHIDAKIRNCGEEAATRRRRDLGAVNRGNHESEADRKSGSAAADHEDDVVSAKAHEERAQQEDGGREDEGVAPTDVVGGPAGHQGAGECARVEDAGEKLDL